MLRAVTAWEQWARQAALCPRSGCCRTARARGSRRPAATSSSPSPSSQTCGQQTRAAAVLWTTHSPSFIQRSVQCAWNWMSVCRMHKMVCRHSSRSQARRYWSSPRRGWTLQGGGTASPSHCCREARPGRTPPPSPSSARAAPAESVAAAPWRVSRSAGRPLPGAGAGWTA